MRTKIIGLIAHTGKPGVAELARAVALAFREKSVRVMIEEATAALMQTNEKASVAEIAATADMIVVLGGDGTILNVVAQTGGKSPPIFGINVGSLGFLTCVNSSAYREAVEAIANDRVAYSERALLSVQLREGDKTISSVVALNDAVVSRGSLSRLIRLQTSVNGEPLTEFNADGLIIATPTGSTAYSLSAGGPVLAPDSGVFVITPICPHVLTNRSVIISDASVVEVRPGAGEYPAFLSVDGREPMRVSAEAAVVIGRAAELLKLGFLPEITFFSVLRQKLKWTGSNI